MREEVVSAAQVEGGKMKKMPRVRVKTRLATRATIFADPMGCFKPFFFVEIAKRII
jgi:hypothetical protein